MSPSSTSSSSPGDSPWRFAGRLLLFLTPILLLVAVFESAAWLSGDSWPMAKLAREHDGRKEILIRPEYFAQSYGYKFDRLRALKPGIVVLGTSRVLQTRDFFFDLPQQTFFNGGGLLDSFADFEGYVTAVSTGDLPKPEITIFGVDPWRFKAGLPADAPTWKTDPRFGDPFYEFGAHVSGMRVAFKKSKLMWPQEAGWAFSPAPFTGAPAIGMAALTKGVGFRIDGSYQYDPRIAFEDPQTLKYQDRETPPVIERIREGSIQFTHGQALDANRVQGLIVQLQRLAGLGVAVHVILPPFSNECYDELEKDPAKHVWWQAYKSGIPEQMRKAGIPCTPPGCPREFGLRETCMWDGFHPGEVLTLRIFKQLADMAGADSKLSRALSKKLDTLAAYDRHPLTFLPDFLQDLQGR